MINTSIEIYGKIVLIYGEILTKEQIRGHKRY